MPYRYAWLFLVALMGVTAFAFWRSYLSRLPDASFEFHAHAITSLFWMILVIVQSWSIHAGHRAFHRTVGLTSFVLFPAFLGGGLLISVGMAKRFLAEGGAFYEMYAARLAPVDAVGVIGIGWCMYGALRDRRRVHLHARYTLATMLFLLGPIGLRVLTRFGPFEVQSLADLYKIAHVLRFVTLVTLGGLALLVWHSPRHGRPWIEAGCFVALQALLFETLGRWSSWREAYPALAQVPSMPLALFGMAVGAAVIWAGWTRGKRPGSAAATM